MEQDPLFAHSPVDLSLEEHRISTLKKVFRFQEFIPKNINPRLVSHFIIIRGRICIYFSTFAFDDDFVNF